MKLLLRNHSSDEFLPGCEYTLVDLDPELMALIARRAETCRRIHQEDGSLTAIRYWDARPVCINSTAEIEQVVVGDEETSLEDLMDEQGGWTVLADLNPPDGDIVETDCQRMVLLVEGDEVEFGWVFLVGDVEVRTDAVKLSALLETMESLQKA
jgi:hypothetical protein